MRIVQGVWQKFKGLRLVSKLIIGYVAMIIVPFGLFGLQYYKEMNENLRAQYKLVNEQLMEQAVNSLQADLTKVESAYPLFQNNSSLSDYLSGTYSSDWELIYNYKNGITPAFSFTRLSNDSITGIQIYKNNPDVLPLAPDIVDADQLPEAAKRAGIDALKPEEGLWLLDQDQTKAGELPELSYYHKLYSENYSQQLGYLQIRASSRVLSQFMAMLAEPEPDAAVVLTDTAHGGRVIYRSPAASSLSDDELAQVLAKLGGGPNGTNGGTNETGGISKIGGAGIMGATGNTGGSGKTSGSNETSQSSRGGKTSGSSESGGSSTAGKTGISTRGSQASSSLFLKQGKEIATAAKLDKLNLTAVYVSETSRTLPLGRQKERFFLLVCGLLLAVLSAVYYVLVSSITTRILRLSRHMKRVQPGNFSMYTGRSGPDEVGFLISSYNSMIMRIDELTHKVHKVELMKKEADFKMLQAQINPHFLYNTLETMRMHALQNDDTDVADMAGTLGKLLRYSLSKSDSDTTLLSELTHVRHYIVIHQVRMGARLETELNVSGAAQEDELAQWQCPRFILQPLVENSFQHGISKKRRKGHIGIAVDVLDRRIVIRIADNGAGIPSDRLQVIGGILAGEIPPEQIPFAGGIGLYNVNERIKAFYGEEFGVSVQSGEGEGTTCILTLGKRRLP